MYDFSLDFIDSATVDEVFCACLHVAVLYSGVFV